MSASTPAVPVERVFDPALERRRLIGTVFYGACIAAIGILLLALLLLLFDVFTRGLPWLDLDFITGVPSRRPERAGILPALVGSIQIAILVGAPFIVAGWAACHYASGRLETAARLTRGGAEPPR